MLRGRRPGRSFDEMPRSGSLEHLEQIPGLCPAYNLSKAFKVVAREFGEEFRDAEVTNAQFAILVNLGIKHPLSTSELADRLGSELSTVSRNMDVLEDRRLVRPAPTTDKRRKDYELTDEGGRAVRDNIARWKRAQQRILKRIGRRRWQETVKTLRLIAES